MTGASPEKLLRNWVFSVRGETNMEPMITPAPDTKIRSATNASIYYSIPTIKLMFTEDRPGEIRYYAINELTDDNTSDNLIRFVFIEFGCSPGGGASTQLVEEGAFDAARKLFDRIEIVEAGKHI